MRSDYRSDRHDAVANTLGSLLKAKREAGGLSLTQFAAQIGISRQYLSRLEHGEYAHPSARVLTRMIQRLGIHGEDLYALTGNLLPSELPSFGPYLRAKYPEWPEMARTELTQFYAFVKYKYKL